MRETTAQHTGTTLHKARLKAIPGHIIPTPPHPGAEEAVQVARQEAQAAVIAQEAVRYIADK